MSRKENRSYCMQDVTVAMRHWNKGVCDLLRSDLFGGRRFGGLVSVLSVIYVLDVVICLGYGRDDDPGEGERDEHYDPTGQVFIQIRGRDGVHTKGTGSTGGLNGLVDTREAGEGEWVVS